MKKKPTTPKPKEHQKTYNKGVHACGTKCCPKLTCHCKDCKNCQ